MSSCNSLPILARSCSCASINLRLMPEQGLFSQLALGDVGATALIAPQSSVGIENGDAIYGAPPEATILSFHGVDYVLELLLLRHDREFVALNASRPSSGWRS